jgi:hypothetical protein
MRSDIVPGGIFPDYELPDHTGTMRKLSELIVRRCPHCSNGHDIIATTADNTKKDNLLELRECRWQ